MRKERKEIYDAYLDKDGGIDEEKKFAALFNEKKSEADLKQKMRDEWDNISTSDLEDVNLDPILYKIHFLINSERNVKHEGHHSVRTIVRWYSRIAAILMLPVLVLWAISQFFSVKSGGNTSTVEVTAPMGAKVKVMLPDGSFGWLNSGSVLKYQVPFKERHVMLKGEAYLNVKSDSLHPFEVEGQRGIVKVLGTRFNVRMWPDDPLTEVVLEEGKVQFFHKKSKQFINITPGEMLILNSKENTLTRKFVNPELYSGWVDGKLLFRGDHMDQVAKKLSRWFNVDVDVADTSLQDYNFRATFENESLDEVLRLLERSSPIEFEIIDHQKNSGGVYSRRKVIIRHK